MRDTAHFLGGNGARTLAFSGVAFIVLGILCGELYAIFVSHVANGVIKQSWSVALEALVRGDMVVVDEAFATIENLATKRGRIMNTHSHLSGYGLLAVVLSFLLPQVGFSRGVSNWLAGLFILGAGIHCLAVYLSYYFGLWLAYAGDMGAMMVLISITAILMGFLKHQSGALESASKYLYARLSNPASKHLLKSGLLLILLGMLFGLFVAWRLVVVDEPILNSAPGETGNAILMQDLASANLQIASFKAAQSRSAITAAAHSHAIEFGMMMVLLALIQNLVMLSDQWKLRWCRLFSVGAYVLPVSVFAATLVGLPAAAMADLAGSFILLALLSMAIGLIRTTGVVDARDSEEAEK